MLVRETLFSSQGDRDVWVM